MSCFLQIFKAQNIFEIKLAEVGDYNGTNQEPHYLKWLLKGFLLTLKKWQAKLVSVRLNEKKIAQEPWIVCNMKCLKVEHNIKKKLIN